MLACGYHRAFAIACKFLGTTYRPPLLAARLIRARIWLHNDFDFSELIAHCVLSFVADNGLTINHHGNVLAYRRHPFFLCAMTNSHYSGRGSKKGGCTLQGLIPDASASGRWRCIIQRLLFFILQESNAYRKVDWLRDKVGENAHRERADKARAKYAKKNKIIHMSQFYALHRHSCNAAVWRRNFFFKFCNTQRS